MTKGKKRARAATRGAAPGHAQSAITIPVLGSDPPAVLAVSRIGPTTIELTPSSGGNPVRLRDNGLGVLSPSVKARRRAFEEARRSADVSVAEWAQISDTVINLVDPAARLEALENYRSKSLDARYARTASRWSDEGRFSANDLYAPAPADVLSHLRVHLRRGDPNSGEADDAESATAWWEEGAAILVAEEGLEVAFARFARLPVPMPDALLRGVAACDSAARRAFVQSVLHDATSPVKMIHAIRVLCSLGAVEHKYGRLARRLARRLASLDCHSQFILLQHVIAEAYAEGIAREPEWIPARSAHPAASPTVGLLVSSWYHGSRFVEQVNAVGATVAHTDEWVANRASQRTSGLFSSQHFDVEDVAHPSLLAYARFIIAGLQYATEGYIRQEDFDGTVQSVLTALGSLKPNGFAEYWDLLRDLGSHTNRLGSWLRPTRAGDGSIAVGASTVVSATASSDALRSEALAELETDASQTRPWLLLFAVDGQTPLGPEEADRFRAAIRAQDIALLLPRLGAVAHLAALRIALEARAANGEPLRRDLREALLRATAASQPEPNAPGAPPKLAVSDELTPLETASLEASYVLALAEPARLDSINRFTADLRALVAIEPAYLTRLRGVLEDLVRDRPAAEGAACISLLLEARAQ